jgi:hypothetical protein
MEERNPMLTRLKPRLSYANVTATMALFVALGGSSYAAVSFTGKQIKDGTITGKDIKNRLLTAKDFRRLPAGPQAQPGPAGAPGPTAAVVGGTAAAQARRNVSTASTRR